MNLTKIGVQFKVRENERGGVESSEISWHENIS